MLPSPSGGNSVRSTRGDAPPAPSGTSLGKRSPLDFVAQGARGSIRESRWSPSRDRRGRPPSAARHGRDRSTERAETLHTTPAEGAIFVSAGRPWTWPSSVKGEAPQRPSSAGRRRRRKPAQRRPRSLDLGDGSRRDL